MEKRHSFGMLVVGGLIALGSIGVALVAASITQPSAQIQDNPVAVVTNDSRQNSDRTDDSDGDGLPNWKEILLGTDPMNPDSDNDGTPDGEEIALGANPLKEGVEPEPEGAYVAPSSLPSTEALARELFVGYADGRRDGVLDENETNAAIAQAITDKRSEQKPLVFFETEDLNIKNEGGIFTYEKNLLEALNKSVQVREYELTVFARAVNTTQTGELDKLRSVASVYEAIRDQLVKMPVPQKIATEHLALVNALSEFSGNVYALGTWGGDPLDALVLVDRFIETESNMNVAIENLFTFADVLKKQS